MFTRTQLGLFAFGLISVQFAGCSASGYSALSSGSEAPTIQAAGWTNGGPPTDLEGNVIVLEIFATW